MTEKSKRDATTPHKKGANKHDPAVKHDKLDDGHRHSKDIHEDRSIRKQKLGKPRPSR